MKDAPLSAEKDASPIDDLLRYAVEEVARLLVQADGGLVYLVDEATGDLVFAQDAGITDQARHGWIHQLRLPRGQGMFGRSLEQGRALVTGTYSRDRSFVHAEGADRVVRDVGIESMVVAPMLDGERPLGALGAFAVARDAFDEADVALVRALADHAAAGIANRRLIDELARSEHQLERQAAGERALRENSSQLVAIRDPGELLQRVVSEASRLVKADGTILSLLDPDEGVLRWAYDDGLRDLFPAEYVANLTLDVGAGPTGEAIATQRATRADDDLHGMFPAGPENDRFFEVTGFRSMIAAPIIGEAGPLGALEVYSRRPQAFDDLDSGLIGSLAGQAAIALTNARLIDELRRSRTELSRRADAEQALRRIAAWVTAATEPTEVVQRAVDEGARLLGGDGARIDVIDPSSGLLRGMYMAGGTQPDDEIWPDTPDERLEHGISGQAVVRNEVVWTGDYLEDDAFPHASGVDHFVRVSGIRSVMAAPLVAESGPFGALTVYTSRPEAFGADEATVLAALADQASIALTNARLIAELGRSREELARRAESERTLREIAAGIAAIRDPVEVLERIVQESRRLLGSDGAHLTLISDDRSYLSPVVVAGADDEMSEAWMRGLRFPINDGINGIAAGQDRATWTGDYLADSRIPHDAEDTEVAERMSLRAMAAAPLRAPGGEVIGTLAISYRTARRMQDDEIQLLQGLADHAAIALSNSRLLERLQTSEERYRYLVQNSPDLVWSVDADARFTFVSDTCERLTGWSPADLLGKHFGALVHPSTEEVATRDWLAGHGDGTHELRGRLLLLHRDGHPIPAEFIAVSRVEDGRFLGANGSVRDMTERERLESEVRDSEERYRYLVKASPDVIWAVDENGRFTFMSDRFAELTGEQPEVVLGQHFTDQTDPESVADTLEAWAAVQRDPRGVYPLQIMLPRRDGEPLPVEIWLTGMIRDGRFVGAHGSIRDLRERLRFERDLRRQAGELAAGEERAHLARELHDSVTQALFSMTLITRSVELLLGRDPEAARERLGSLRELQRDALAEMRSLIFELRPGSLEQDGLVHALRTHAAAVEGRIGLPIVVDAEEIGRLPIDVEDALYRIAQEALHNIVKHAAARSIHVALGRTRGGIRLRIDDDGRGFDPGAVPSGHLGLAGMRARCERVGGQLTIRSRADHGTRIEVVVPVSPGAAGDGTVPEAAAPAVRRNGTGRKARAGSTAAK